MRIARVLKYGGKISSKNTADIALAPDALEAPFDGRDDTFCLVTSGSDFAYLYRKLHERGATICIVGEAKIPQAHRPRLLAADRRPLRPAEHGQDLRRADLPTRGRQPLVGELGAEAPTA